MRKLLVCWVTVLAVVSGLTSDSFGSNTVDLGDVEVLAANWLVVNDPLNAADLTGDEDVNILDFELLASNWLEQQDEINISDHIDMVAVSSYVNYNDPDMADDTAYHFEIIITTDELVSKLYFETVTGNLFAIASDAESVIQVGDATITTRRTYDAGSDSYEWFYDASFTTSSGLAGYADGNITITSLFGNGQRGSTDIWFGVPGTNDSMSMPVQEPVITTISNNSTVSSPVTLEWDEYSGDDANYLAFEAVSETNEDIYISGPMQFYPGGFSNPVEMGEGDWLVKLAFAAAYPPALNDDDIMVQVSKYSEVDYSISVANN